MIGLYGAIDAVLSDRLENVEVALPGKIERYFPAEQRAHVKPLVHFVSTDGDGIAKYTKPLPVITGVPVVFFCAGDYSVTAPVNVGDFVMLVFQSQSIDEWLFSDGRDTDPKDPRRHNINDAICIPGLRPFTKALPSAQLPHLSLGKEGGLRIHVKQNEVCLGEENPSELVAIASRVEAAINSLTEKFNMHVHNVTAVATPTGPAIAPPLPNAPPIDPDAEVPPMAGDASGLGSSTVRVKP
jgi:hypothetical protein